MDKCTLDLENVQRFLNDYENGVVLHGEWLKSNSLSQELNYVVYNVSQYGVYLSYEVYKPILDKYNITAIPKHEIGLVIEK